MPKRSKAPTYYVRRAMAEKSNPKESSYHLEVDRADRYSIRSRSLNRAFFEIDELYASFLREFFSKENIVEVLRSLHKNKKRPVRILDDGAGWDGAFVAGLKQKLKEAGLKSHTIALNLNNSDELRSHVANGRINEVHIGDAGRYVPDKPVDAIFSTVGSLNYFTSKASKNHLLKFAHCLRKGGILVAMVFGEKLKSITPGYLHGIEIAFGKQGFRAKIYRPNKESEPILILMIQRI